MMIRKVDTGEEQMTQQQELLSPSTATRDNILEVKQQQPKVWGTLRVARKSKAGTTTACPSSMQLTEATVVLGRSPKCDVTVPSDNGDPAYILVSNRHCCLSYDAETDKVTLEDTSANGTCWNETTVLQRNQKVVLPASETHHRICLLTRSNLLAKRRQTANDSTSTTKSQSGSNVSGDNIEELLERYTYILELPELTATQNSMAEAPTQSWDAPTQQIDDEEGGTQFSPHKSPQQARPRPWGRLLPTQTGRDALDLLTNAVTLGRNPECDIQPHMKPTTPQENQQVRARREWAFGVISNKHCTILSRNSATEGRQVFVEDCSGNGTLVNRMTLLRRGEKRLLHSGDEICLVNPKVLQKKICSTTALEDILKQYSFVYVNLQYQEAPLILHPASANRKAAVNPRATRRHSLNRVQQHQSPSNRPRIEEDYDIRDLLGSGTVGQVRRAIHRQTGAERAIKIIGGDGRNRRLVQQDPVEAEAAMLRELKHPYIVQLIDMYVSDRTTKSSQCVYLVMELLQGGDLFDRIVEKEKYTEVESRRVMRRLLCAIHYLHEDCNIVHRDIKPENILLSSKTNCIDVKITDFGLAKQVQADGLKSFCGTPQYFAPEVLKRRSTVMGKGRYGKPADMWSLGVVLYVLLSGTLPFDDNDPKGAVSFPPEHWVDVSEPAKELIRCLLRASPLERYTVKQACRHPWIHTEDGDTHTDPLSDPAVVKALHKSESDPAIADTPATEAQRHEMGPPLSKLPSRSPGLSTERTSFRPVVAQPSAKLEPTEENTSPTKRAFVSPQARRSSSSLSQSGHSGTPSPVVLSSSRTALSPVHMNCGVDKNDNVEEPATGKFRLSSGSAFTPPAESACPPRVSEEAFAPVSTAKSDGSEEKDDSVSSFSQNTESITSFASKKSAQSQRSPNSMSSAEKLPQKRDSLTTMFEQSQLKRCKAS